MIDSIRDQAAWIEDRLWDVAIDCYGLTRTHETIERINATFMNGLNDDARKLGKQPPFGNDEHHEPIDGGLAAAFMAVCSVEREDNPIDAIKMLVVAAEALGAMGIVGKLRVLGTERIGEDKKSGSLGASLNHNVLSKQRAASVMAKKRHAENYKLSEDALKYWRENISPDLSAQKAASELIRVVPVSHKKLAEIVSIEKKKASLVRTPEPERKPEP